MKSSATNINDLKCYHCGDACPDDSIHYADKAFCCDGCKTVFTLLSDNDLCDYYSFDQTPGISPKSEIEEEKFAYLDNEGIQQQLLDFKDEQQSLISLNIPSIHCSSCIWLLENLHGLEDGVVYSKVNFQKKEIKIRFNHKEVSLKSLVSLLSSLGYEPLLRLENFEKKKNSKTNRSLLFRIGVAGFCFGNIMLFSFPEYVSSGNVEPQYKTLFNFISFALALPVFFYSGNIYLSSALKSIKQKIINIDVPIALGMLALMFKSTYDIIATGESGYFDSLAGLIFFLLLGRWFQEKTYYALTFDKDYKAYFPLAVSKLCDGEKHEIPLTDIKKGDRLFIKHGEIFPCDSVLLKNRASVDYSFVSGESYAIDKKDGDFIYAGGKNLGQSAEVEALTEVSQSQLTKLWNNQAFEKNRHSPLISISNNVSKYFTYAVLTIALITAIFWFFIDSSKIFPVVASILIVACPCALALSIPFTFGSLMRILGNNSFFVKKAELIENLAQCKQIIFDKTGTLTETETNSIEYKGNPLSEFETETISALASQSNHPLSKAIFKKLNRTTSLKLESYREKAGLGIEAEIKGRRFKIGNGKWVGLTSENSSNFKSTFVSIDEKPIGYFVIRNKYRKGISQLAKQLQKHYHLSIVSGDNDIEAERLKNIFGANTELSFFQSPEDKLARLAYACDQEKTIMVGDGLNDAGALANSDFGISVNNKNNHFTPASDAILDEQAFTQLPDFLKLAKSGKTIVITSFIISFMYNIIGLSLAVQGLLSPVIAAILMPVSSITIVAFTTSSVWLNAKMKGLK